MFYSDSENISPQIRWRREVVFMLLSGLFLGTLAMLNILGISRIIQIPVTDSLVLPLTVGVLPYPLTFLCTDFISELYGKKRANLVVWIGLVLNAWVLFILWLGGALPPTPTLYDVDGKLILDAATNKPHNDYVFYTIRSFTFATTFASMIAYLAAQFCDVHIFHYLKSKTKGKHLWLRNNGSTLVSQLVDTVAVMLISHFFAHAFDGLIAENGGDAVKTLTELIMAGYLFKFIAALLDTIPFYIGTKYLAQYLQINNEAEHF